jgi:hypothetical protein
MYVTQNFIGGVMLVDELIEMLKVDPSLLDTVMQRLWSIGAEVCREIDDGLESLQTDLETASD